MKKRIIFFPLLLTTTLTLISSNFLGNEKNIIDNTKEKTTSINETTSGTVRTIKVNNYDDWLKIDDKGVTNDTKIIITNDIDFSNFKPKDTLNLISINNYNLEITGENANGKDFKLYNKPVKYAFDPIIISKNFTEGIYFHNLNLDGMGTIFDTIKQDSFGHNYGEDGKGDEHGKGAIDRKNSLFFENIVIENNLIDNQDFKETSSHDDGHHSLFINEVNLNEAGDTYDDNAVTFNNIVIKNNHIKNNTFDFENQEKTESFSWLTSIVYNVCHTSHHKHQGFVKYENINIENNSFFDNDITKNFEFSFGNINGAFTGLSNWIGSDGNFLSLNDILIQDNLIEKPKNISEKNFSYAELISQPNKVSKDNQWTSITGIKNVYSINNAVFNSFNKDNYLKSDFFSNDNKIAISLSNKNDNTWKKENTNNVFFIVPDSFNSRGSEVDFNIIFDKLTNEVDNDNVKSLDLLTTNNSSFEVIKNGLQNYYGIYGVANSFIKDKDRNNTNKIKAFITSQENQGYGIISDLVVEGDSKEESYQNAKITFNFLQAKEDINVNQKNPYLLSNLELKSNGKVISKPLKDNVTTTAQDNYLYKPIFDLKEGLTSEDIDLNNLSISFSHDNPTFIGNSRSNETTEIKLVSSLNPGDTINIKFGDNGGASKTLVIVLESLSLIILLILLLLLILFLVLRQRKNNLAKETGVQDGFLEYNPDLNFAEYQEAEENYEEANYYEEDEYYQEETDYYEDEYYQEETEYYEE